MAIATLIIEDVDVVTGEVRIGSKIEGSLVDDGQMTAAELMVRVLLSEINTPSFRAKMWAQVEQMTAGTDARISNADMKEQAIG